MPGATVFPFPARRRVAGSRLGQSESVRRGQSADVASSRPYQPGDDMRMIDWGASAKLSAVKGQDAFVVREFFAEETPYAAVVVDRSGGLLEMAPAPLLDKLQTTKAIVSLIADSAVAARSRCSYLDSSDASGWISPHTRNSKDTMLRRLAKDAPVKTAPGELLAELSRRSADVPLGTLVFVLSDFAAGGFGESWLLVEQLGWEVVPVVIQDEIWERSFPLDAGGLVMPLRSGLSYVSARQARRLHDLHEQRCQQLAGEFVERGVQPIHISSSDPAEILGRFLAWSRSFAPRRR